MTHINPIIETRRWRFYTDATPDGSMVALAAENATPTLTGAQTMGGIIRLRVQVAETGGGSNTPALNLQMSADGGTTWDDVADESLSGVTDPPEKWFRLTNGAATSGGTLGTALLTGTLASGTYHEARGQTEAIAANDIREVDFAIKPVWPPPITTVRFRLLNGATVIPVGSTFTNPELTTCAVADRSYTIDRAETQTDGEQNRELNHSAWPRLHWDGTHWWFFVVQPDNAAAVTYYRWDGATPVTGDWTKATQAMTGNVASPQDNDVRHAANFGRPGGAHAVAIGWFPASGNMRVRRGLMGGGTVTWNTEVDLGQARYGWHNHLAIDDGGFWWVGGIDGTTGVWAVRSTAADDGSSGYNPAFGTVGTRRKTVADTGVSNNDIIALVPLASDKVLLVWRNGTALKWATCTDAGGFSAVGTVSTTAAISPTDWGIARSGDWVYLVHTDSAASGGNWVLRVYSISGNTWATGTSPAVSGQPSLEDGIVVVPNDEQIHVYGSFTGTEGGKDRTVAGYTYTGPGAAGSWDSGVVITPAGGRGNGDDLAGPDLAANGQVPVAYITHDVSIAAPQVFEYHVQAVTTGISGTMTVGTATATAAADGNLTGAAPRRALVSWVRFETPPASGAPASLIVAPAAASAAAAGTLTGASVFAVDAATAPAAADGNLTGAIAATLTAGTATAAAAGGGVDLTGATAATLTVGTATATAASDGDLSAGGAAALSVSPATASAAADGAFLAAAVLTIGAAPASADAANVVLSGGTGAALTVDAASATGAADAAFTGAATLTVTPAPAAADVATVGLGGGEAGTLAVSAATAPAAADGTLTAASVLTVGTATAGADADATITVAAVLPVDAATAGADAAGTFTAGATLTVTASPASAEAGAVALSGGTSIAGTMTVSAATASAAVDGTLTGAAMFAADTATGAALASAVLAGASVFAVGTAGASAVAAGSLGATASLSVDPATALAAADGAFVAAAVMTRSPATASAAAGGMLTGASANERPAWLANLTRLTVAGPALSRTSAGTVGLTRTPAGGVTLTRTAPEE